MIIDFNTEHLDKIEDKFKRNCYKLPFKIDECNVLLVEYHEVSNEYLWVLGNIVDDEFMEKLKFYSNGYTSKVNLLKNQMRLDEYLT